jgi:hypothetical protein
LPLPEFTLAFAGVTIADTGFPGPGAYPIFLLSKSLP